MRSRTKRALIVLGISLSSLGCTYFEPQYRVTPSFTVHVSNHYGPIAGLTIRATRPRDPDLTGLVPDELNARLLHEQFVRVMESTTDANGDAHFDLDRFGHWYVEPDNSASGLDYVSVFADPHFETGTVNIQWPGFKILEVKQLKGRISGGLLHSQTTPLKQTILSVHDFVSLAEVATTKTGDDGSFRFDGVMPGVYFLGVRVKAASNSTGPEGYIPVYVGDGSPRESLSIEIELTSCGVMYDLEENRSRNRPETCMKGSGEFIPCP
jgi:hypothetical protein